MDVALIVLGWAAGALVLYLLGQRWLLARQMRDRIYEGTPAPAAAGPGEAGFLAHSLSLAGYRDPGAARTFVALTLIGLGAGLLAAYLFTASGATGRLLRGLAIFPGGVGDLFVPFVYVAPWLLVALLACGPWLVVRAARRRRVRQVEEDLPLTLELLATLGQAGIGFDAALQRVVSSQPPERPLTVEFRTFQVELLAGQGRVASLRRLARRVEVLPFTLFVSALVQAEQTGGGVADVLRRQADDLRARRREQALAFAMALPVKLLFPLVVCFLPGIFVATLGPTFHQFFQFADQIIRTRDLLP